MEFGCLLVECAKALPAVAVLWAPPASAGDLESAARASDYYRANVFTNESGIYEHGGDLFVHARVRLDRSRPNARKRACAEAMLLTSTLIRDWAKDATAAERAAATASESALFAKALLDSFDPGWQYPEWPASAKAKVLADDDRDGYYTIGMVADRDALAKSIPAEFRQPCPIGRLSARLPAVSRRMLSGAGRARFLEACGVGGVVSAGKLPDAGSLIALAKALEGVGNRRLAWGAAVVALGTGSDVAGLGEAFEILGLEAPAPPPRGAEKKTTGFTKGEVDSQIEF